MIHLFLFITSLCSAQVTPLDIKDVPVKEAIEDLAKKDLTKGGNVAGNVTVVGAGNGIKWADGSTSTTAALPTAASSTGIDVSTFGYLPGQIVTNTVLGPCLISTVTLTVANVPLDVWFVGSVSNNSTQESVLGFLVNGKFISPYSSTIGVTVPAPISTQCQNASFRVRIPAQGAGSVSMCLTAATTGAVDLTIVGLSRVCPYVGTFKSASQFGFSEAH